MTDKRRGHVPVLVDPVSKTEKCKLRRDTHRRGEKWARPCPGKNGNG